MEEEAEQEKEALRLEAMAEAKYKSSNISSALKYSKRAQRLVHDLDGISEMVTSLDIVSVASESPTPDWYKILQVEPFAHPNVIRKHYKKLALTLHPDKNPHVASEEAFKLVSEAFRFLSDKIRRNEYDMKLRIRIRIQDEATDGQQLVTFWTACCTCRLMHQFERKYVGHNLVFPSCKKSFKAVEVENGNESEEEEEEMRIRNRSRKLRVASLSKKVGTVGKSRTVNGKVSSEEVEPVTTKSSRLKDKVVGVEVRNGELESEGAVGKWSGGRLRSGGLKRRMSTVGDVFEKIRTCEETMTLAEMQSDIKKKAQQKRKMKLKLQEKEEDKTEKWKEQGGLQKALKVLGV